MGELGQAIAGILYRLKKAGAVRLLDDGKGHTPTQWALREAPNGFALGDAWPMSVHFPPLPVPGTVRMHERVE